MSKLRLLHAVIAIDVDESPKKYGSIEIPTSALKNVETGTVVAAGPGEYDKKGKFFPNPVKEGDRVIFAKGSGTKVKIDEQVYLMVTPREITGILR